MATNVTAFTPRLREDPSPPRRTRIAFRSGESTFYPHLDEVIWIQARRNYSHIYMAATSFTVRELLSSVEQRLERHGFFRVQRSAIINLEHVVEIRRERRARYAVILTDGTSVIVSPGTKERIESLLAAG
jgi:two-component system LytT family response regulator